MSRFSFRCAISCLVFALPLAADAAHMVELSARVNEAECGPSCGDSQTVTGPGTAGVSYSYPLGGSGSAFATVLANENGGLIIKAYATATGGSGEGEFVNMGAAAYASWQDDIYFTGTMVDLAFEFGFEFTGSVSGDALMSFDAIGCYDDGSCFPPLSFNKPGIYGIPTTPSAGALFSPDERMNYSVSVSAGATGHGSAFGGPNTSTADVSHTLTLRTITLRDAAGNIVPGVTIHSESGFDYNAFVVPEPSALVLFALGCAALVARRW